MQGFPVTDFFQVAEAVFHGKIVWGTEKCANLLMYWLQGGL
jgi:hypothetical protein